MPAIGIDLGTTFCCVATFRHGQVEIIPNDQGNVTTPSYVAFTGRGRLVGEAARNQATSNPQNTIYDAKRLIGRRIDETTVAADRVNWPFEVTEEEGKAKIKVCANGKPLLLLPEEVSSILLEKMKHVAEAYLREPVTDAILTVPAYFNNAQRQATKDAGLIAGLNVLRVISEPTAAAIAYGLDKKLKSKCNILVYDLGGGTFDVSVMSIEGKNFIVKSTYGNTHLGGQDFDQRMVNYLVKEFERKYNIDLRQNRSAIHRVRMECERMKRLLSVEYEAHYDLGEIVRGFSIKGTMSRAKFEDLNMDLFKSTLDPVTMALHDSGLEKSEIKEIVLVGGSTRIPAVRKLVSKHFNGQRLNTSINADEAVACGAALQAASMIGDHSETLKDLLMKDVTPLSLGIQLYDGRMRVVVKRNTPVPTKAFKGLQTTQDYQTECTFNVFEGERAIAADNHFLDSFHLTGIHPARRGLVKFDLRFHVDEDGILRVSVSERGTENGGEIQISKAHNGLSDKEIARMRADAQRYQALDQEHQDRLVLWNALESMAYSIKRKLSENSKRHRLTDYEKRVIIAKCDNTMQWLQQNRMAHISKYESKLTELQEVCRPFTKLMNI